MTELEAKNKLVAWALAQIGYTESGDNWNKYAPMWTQAGGWNAQNQPWCDVFVDCGFIENFGLDAASRMTYQPKGGFSALCSASANYYKANGAWFSTPQVGDQAFFYSGGGINHTGIVTDVAGGLVVCVEGNSSDMVARRSYAIGSAQIAGYGRPKWSVVEDAEDKTPGTPAPAPGEPEEPTYSYFPYVYAVRVNLLKQGCYGPQVTHMQQLLAANGFDPGDIDGDFGPATAAALRDFQSAAGIGVDGEWGGESFNAMWNYKKYFFLEV